MKNSLKFITIIFALITLSALLAHLLELRVKIRMSKEDYLVTQSIYQGWALLSFFEIGAIVLTVIWTIAERKNRKTFTLLLTSSLLFIISLVVFFTFTYPANNSTLNWTQLPADWKQLRNNWEYSHAANAIINFIGFSLLIWTLLLPEQDK